MIGPKNVNPYGCWCSQPNVSCLHQGSAALPRATSQCATSYVGKQVRKRTAGLMAPCVIGADDFVIQMAPIVKKCALGVLSGGLHPEVHRVGRGHATSQKARVAVPLFPFFARCHPHGGDTLRAISAVAAERRGPAFRRWIRPLSRNCAAMVEPFRPDVCSGHSAPAR